MGIFMKPWFATAVFVAAVGFWAFTVAPWGLWHEQTTSTRLELRGDTYQRQTAASPEFSLSGGPTTLMIAAAPSVGDSLMAAVSWELIPTPPRAGAVERGNEGLVSPYLESGTYDFASDLGVDPNGRFRLRLSAASDAAASITATVTEQRGYWHGVPVYGIVLLAGIAYIGLTVVPRRRRYQADPLIVVGQRHEA
jgi:hypothetical protein